MDRWIDGQIDRWMIAGWIDILDEWIERERERAREAHNDIDIDTNSNIDIKIDIILKGMAQILWGANEATHVIDLSFHP